MTKFSCPNCEENKELVVLECDACGSTTMKCLKCKRAFKIEEGKLIPIKE